MSINLVQYQPLECSKIVDSILDEIRLHKIDGFSDADTDKLHWASVYLKGLANFQSEIQELSKLDSNYSGYQDCKKCEFGKQILAEHFNLNYESAKCIFKIFD